MTVLFEDEYACVTQTHLRIKRYHFPFMNAKEILIKDIVEVVRGDQAGLGILDMKGWGMGVSPIWWACYLKRRVSELNNDVIVTIRDASIKCAFRSTDATRVVRMLRDKILDVPGVVTDTMPLM
jgi:hypothetical protein